MNNKSKETIQNAIKFILDIRMNESIKYIIRNQEPLLYKYKKSKLRAFFKQQYQKNGLMSVLKSLNKESLASDLIRNKEFDLQLIELNKLLDKQDQLEDINLLAKNIKKIQAKDYIDAKEFKEIYGFSTDWQKNRRGRIHDPLPYRQESANKKITYVVSDINIWFENNNSGRKGV